MEERVDVQRIPLKVYRSQDRVTVAAPMAGIEPEDVSVEVTGDDRLILHGELRGVLKGLKELVLDEWNIGGYHRELKLPSAVDGELATLTYGNGVLVVTLPIRDQTRTARLRLTEIGVARGEHVGSAGHPPHAVTDTEHRQARASMQTQHGGNPALHG